jgi:hypothetical protein
MKPDMVNESFGQEQILLGDIYHWKLDEKGYFVVQENYSKEIMSEKPTEDFVAFDLNKITENICDD